MLAPRTVQQTNTHRGTHALLIQQKHATAPRRRLWSAAANWGEECAVRQFNWSILAHKLEMHNFLCVPHFGAAVALQHDNY